MMTVDELLARIAGVERDDLDLWLEEGWVRPGRRGGQPAFRDIDVARVRLIVEIRDELDVRRENIPLVLSLIDQVHGLRGELRALAAAVNAQSEDVRKEIRRHLKRKSRR